jgi:hypothetical protein
MELRKRATGDLVDLDWQSLWDMLEKLDPKDGVWYIITINKGQPNEYRTKFLTYQEAKDLIGFALEKKRLRVPMTL